MSKIVKLHELIEIKNGKDYKYLETGDVPVYGSGGLMTYVNNFLYEGESILLPRKGTLDNIMYVNQKFWTVDTMYWSIIDASKVYPKYLFCYLSLLDLSSKNSGSTLPSMTFDSYYDIPVKIIDYKLQKRIGDFYFKLTNKIELNNKINAELEAMAKTLYDYWFLQFEFPNEEGKPYKSSGGKMVWNEELKREIPEKWILEPLENCVEDIIDRRGVTPKKLGGEWVEQGIKAISAKCVKNGKLINLEEANQVSEEIYNKWMSKELQDGDILMTSEAPLGEFYFLLGDERFCLSQRLFAIRSNFRVKPIYLYYELSRGNGNSQIMGSKSGSTVFGIRQDELRKIKIMIPDENVQTLFENKIISAYREIRKNDYENRELTSLRDFLLPLLMNGQVGFKE